MSCRALGLGIEDALLAYIVNQLAGGNAADIVGRLLPTAVNTACHSFFNRNGFTPLRDDATQWSRSLAMPMAIPFHVAFDAPEDQNSSLLNPLPGMAQRVPGLVA